ncbi:unnamed protein product, partial [Prorocentrum cordatum]
GPGNPVVFKSVKGKFLEWYRKTRAYLVAVFGEQSRRVLEWVEDQAQDTTPITIETVRPAEGEIFSIVLNALRGKRRALLRRAMTPLRSTPADLRGGLEGREGHVRLCEKRRAGGNAEGVEDDAKMAAQETVVPEELKLHLAMNRARLGTSDKMPDESPA